MWAKPAFSVKSVKEKALPVIPPLQLPDPYPFPGKNEKSLTCCDVVQNRQYSPPTDHMRGAIEESSLMERSSLNQLIVCARSLLSPFASPQPKHWKPKTLQAPILGPFILLSLILIIVLEFLAHVAGLSSSISGNGAIAYADGDGNISGFVNIAYLYFPTVIAVCYSMVWSWVDLDVKRLEPWFQLSRPDGASAESSLLLQYPFEFLAFVPVKAARRRQWAVFFTGTAMMIIFWVITPLQSAIFGTGTVNRIRQAQMATTASLMPLDLQVNFLNVNFLITAYSVSWLGQKIPPYTTPTHAVLPFAPILGEPLDIVDGIWLTSAEAYSTNLTCTPAEVIPHGNFTYDFDNRKGCFVPGLVLPNTESDSSRYVLAYISYYGSASSYWALDNPSCLENNSHNFLAIWADGTSQTQSGEYNNMTALFCEPSYVVQNTTVQVNASDFSVVVDGFEVVDPSNSSLPTASFEDIFNVTNFEYIIGTSVTQRAQVTDFPYTDPVEQYPRISNYNITWPSTNMVGYAIAAEPNPAKLGDPAALHSAFLQAHQLLFAVAFNALLEPLSDTANNYLRDGIIQDQPMAIILVRVFSTIVEILLAIMCIIAATVWYISYQRESQMVRDPGRIGDIMCMVSECHALKEIFRNMGTISKEQLNVRLGRKKFRLRGFVAHTPHIMHLEILPNRHDSAEENIKLDHSHPASSEGYVTPFRPVELGNLAASLFIFTLVISIGGLLYLNKSMSRTNGLGLPSNNAAIRQILENYLPTILATILEPFWVILNRLLCVLKPFDELRKGRARPSRSIDARYMSLPPQLVFWRALRSHHFLLAIVCVVAMLANVLAVSLSGLLNEATTSTYKDIPSAYTVGSYFDGTQIRSLEPEITYSDHFFVTFANYSSNTNLPPWIGSNFYYTPFNLDNPASNVNDLQFSAITRGYGVDVMCQEISNSSVENRVNFTEHGEKVEFSIQHRLLNGSEITCVDSRDPDNFEKPTVFNQNMPGNGTNGFEVIVSLRPAGYNTYPYISDAGECERLLVAGWVRMGPGFAPVTENPTDGTLEKRPINSLFMLCQPTFRTALFDVTVNSNGQILHAEQSSPFDTDLQPFFRETTTAEITNSAGFIKDQIAALHIQINELIAGVGGNSRSFQWHNATIAPDWATYLLTLKLNSTELVNVTAPIPSASAIAPALESFYQQLFAAIIGLNTHIFGAADSSQTVTVTVTIPEVRIYMSDVMFKVTIIILLVNFLVALVYYTRRPKRFLPMMPTTIASIAGFVVATRAIQDYSWDGCSLDRGDENNANNVDEQMARETRYRKLPTSDIPKRIAREDLRYGYGRFIDTDGMLRIGIERHPWVVPLNNETSVNLGERTSWRFWNRRGSEKVAKDESNDG